VLRKVLYFCIAYALAGTVYANADVAPDQTIHLTNGATAVSYYHCGDMDLCSKISYQDGSTLSIYSEGAALCQPYFLHFVLADATGKTLYEFSRQINHTADRGVSCGHTVSTEMVLDRGYVHLLVTENPDGTLNLDFSATNK
jgi:hypothetical protein